MVNKQLINGLKYEKLSEEQLYDLSSWELVDIILAYRKDYKAKEQECEELKNAYTRLNSLYNDNCNFTDKLEKALTEIKEIAYRLPIGVTRQEILQKISEVEEQC